MSAPPIVAMAVMMAFTNSIMALKYSGFIASCDLEFLYSRRLSQAAPIVIDEKCQLLLFARIRNLQQKCAAGDFRRNANLLMARRIGTFVLPDEITVDIGFERGAAGDFIGGNAEHTVLHWCILVCNLHNELSGCGFEPGR